MGDGGGALGGWTCGAVSPSRVALGRASEGAGVGTARVVTDDRCSTPIFVASSASSSKIFVDSPASSKMCVASSSSSQSMSTEAVALAFTLAGRVACAAEGGGGTLEMRAVGAGATTGGSDERPGGGGGMRDGDVPPVGSIGVVATGAVMPRSVRLASPGLAATGGGGGTLRPVDGARAADVPLPRPSKISRSDPPLSFCAIEPVSCIAAHRGYHGDYGSLL